MHTVIGASLDEKKNQITLHLHLTPLLTAYESYAGILLSLHFSGSYKWHQRQK
jgi:hypothetical protein